MSVDALVAEGRTALDAGHWSAAGADFERALAERRTAEALDGLAEALWWLGQPQRSVEHREAAYSCYRRDGNAQAAAMAAIALGITYKANFANGAAAGGWIARASRLVAGHGPAELTGWLLVARGYVSSAPDRGAELAQRALDVALDVADTDLELCALSMLGRCRVAMGQIDDGLALIDEAMAGTLAGECRRLDTVVYACCDMLVACDEAADLERATQWCRVADDFIARYGCPFLYAECRTLYGSILLQTGHWLRAEQELLAALAMVDGAGPAMEVKAVTLLAELRLRQGRLEEAESLLSNCEGHAAATLSVAALRLARGERSASSALLERHLQALDDRRPQALPALELLAEAQLALGDLDGAASTARRVNQLAEALGHPLHAGRAAIVSGRVSAAAGHHDLARQELARAVVLLSAMELPLEGARARRELARVLAPGHAEAAQAEARRALATFERLGAASDADATASLLRSLGSPTRTGLREGRALSRREREVLVLIGHGLSNPEIAERLYISKKTASHHVSSVLAKLGLRNRAAAAVYATRLLDHEGPGAGDRGP